MCLAIPGKVIELFEDGGLRMGVVDFGSIRRRACLEYAPEIDVGSYAVIHVGFAISAVDEEDAARSYALLGGMGNLSVGRTGLDSEPVRCGAPPGGPDTVPRREAAHSSLARGSLSPL